MKKLSLLLAALTVMFAASAITPITTSVDRHGMKTKVLRSLVKQETPRMADVVTDQPEGTLVLLKRGSEGCYIYANNGSVYIDYQAGNVMAVISDDGKTMWIKDIVAGVSTGAWVKGDINDDGTTLRVEMNQSIYHDTYTNDAGEEVEYDVLLGWNTSEVVYDDEGNADLQVTRDERTTEIEFSIEGNVLTLLHSEGATDLSVDDLSVFNATGLGVYYSDDLQCLAYIDWNTTFTNNGPIEVLPVITEQPEGELVTYVRGGNTLYLESILWFTFVSVGEQSGKVDVVYAPDGKTVYIKDIMYGYEINTWVKGELDEQGLIHVPAGQCIYWSDQYMGGVVLTMGHIGAMIDDEGFEIAEPIDDEILFQVDGKTITLVGSSADVDDDYYYVTGLTGFWTDDDSNLGSIDWNTTLNELHIEPAVPANPTANDWDDRGNENGNNRFYFTINLEDVDGNALDADYVYYSIYTDNDQIFTFDAATYGSSGLTEDMTEVPYSIQNYDLHPENGYVYMYRTNADGYETFFNERIGIQVHYIVDGVKNSSDIVYWYKPIAVPAVPANPTADDWYDCGSEGGYSRFYFTIDLHDVDGNALVKDNVYYSIYTDNDEIFTFDANTYGSSGVTEDMTLLPYTLQRYDLYPNNGYVYFYRTNKGDNPFFNERIGIQVHYIVDGIDNASDIVYWYLPQAPEEAATPADPVAVEWYDSGDVEGYSYFQFELPELDTEGNPLVQEYLSYSIYTDNDELFVFDANTYYSDLDEDMEAIPYEIWSNGWDFYSSRVYFYYTNEGDNPLFNNRIGIQVHYTTGEGVFSSNIVYLDVDHTAVNELNVGKTVANVRYFNIAGQEMAQPEGMTIKVTTYTDGTTSTSKVVK
ncbi:MAG: hypothetical protein IJK41_12050 [Muribaculaceae bacterium]|nr:hypothetical protein [Muribaculaceae bacterium]